MGFKDDIYLLKEEYLLMRRKGIIITSSFNKFVFLAVKERIQKIRQNYSKNKKIEEELPNRVY